MTAEFEQLATFAETLYGENFSRTGYGEFAVAADGGVKELRHQTGLDTEVEYVFTRETPVEKTDPRPWENLTRTTHTLSITGSAPMRILLDNVVKSVANKGERVENQKPIDWKSITKESLVDAAKDAPMGALYAALPGTTWRTYLLHLQHFCAISRRMRNTPGGPSSATGQMQLSGLTFTPYNWYNIRQRGFSGEMAEPG